MSDVEIHKIGEGRFFFQIVIRRFAKNNPDRHLLREERIIAADNCLEVGDFVEQWLEEKRSQEKERNYDWGLVWMTNTVMATIATEIKNPLISPH